ncbi:MAG: TetR/AcrR family transcriptional regulator C-terminal domain-containing protein [Phenylobacterium sp.]|uniref:TetR family transcriptional regulator n=1 Tax=Phenylobacterium sp. TaxID=1871053 RepID=UPI001A3D6B1F|nr:TetR family transcriptional regulator [Phenylobacterium sp.]MBL8556056.1 TetR/AcrR family transcriptional regulator C-terminal domain-containing protein [Phenylobacterium sp.]
MSIAEHRPPLDKAVIVATALRLLDDVGLDELSTRRLAAELGVKGPSLYWHFKSMGELRDHMAEALLSAEIPPPDPDPRPGDWRDWMAEGARGIRRAAHSRRDGGRLLVGWRPTPERRARLYPANRARLEASGFGADDARLAFLAVGRYAMGWALTEQATDGRTPQSDADFESGLSAMLDGFALRLRRG